MKKYGVFLMTMLLSMLLWSGSVLADSYYVEFYNPSTVDLYVDAAPNVYGSPDYAPWQDAAFAAAANGTFVNMISSSNSANIGTTDFEIQDEVVYSFGDLGRRLTWVYWMPGQTKAGLAGRVEVSLLNTWNGAPLDFYLDYYGSTWLTPSNIFDYDIDGDGTPDGVVGLAGMAWWGAYQVNTQEALDADIAAWGLASETWEFKVKLDGRIFSLTSNRDPVPEPSTMVLFSLGLMGLAGLNRRKK